MANKKSEAEKQQEKAEQVHQEMNQEQKQHTAAAEPEAEKQERKSKKKLEKEARKRLGHNTATRDRDQRKAMGLDSKPPSELTYRNDTAEELELEIVMEQGEKPKSFKAKPGGTVEGPATYRDAFVREGFVELDEDGDVVVSAADLNRYSPARKGDDKGEGKLGGVVDPLGQIGTGTVMTPASHAGMLIADPNDMLGAAAKGSQGPPDGGPKGTTGDTTGPGPKVSGVAGVQSA